MAIITVNGQEISADSGQTIESTFRAAGMLPDAFIFLVDGRPVPMDTPVRDSMSVKAIKVASGG